jgi:O-antigen ligase
VSQPLAASLSRHPWARNGPLLMVAMGGVAAAGALVAVNPILGVTVALPFMALPLLIARASIRLAAVVLGALAVFQSSQEVGPAKFTYVGVAGLCMAISATRIWKAQHPSLQILRPLIPATVALAAIIGVSGIVAHAGGVNADDWARDVLPYLLLVILPIVGADAALDTPPGWLEAFIGVLSVMGAVGITLDWLQRRDVSSLGVGRILLSTTVLVALGFSLAITRAGLGPRRIAWLLVALSIMAALLLSGSRANLVLLVVIAGVVGAGRKARIRVASATRIGIAIGIGVTLLLPWAAARVIDDPQFVTSRVRAAQLVLTGHADSDQSFDERRLSYGWATSQLRAHPWMGTGPGFRYFRGRLYADEGHFTLDTPFITPAKFGLVGTAVIVAYLVALVLCVHRSRRLIGYRPTHTVARGWATILIALLPFGSSLEDKGFAISVMLLIALVTAQTRVASTEPAG